MSRKLEPSTNNCKSAQIAQISTGIPISFLLVVPLVLQIFTTVGITGYLSFRNGQKAVNDLVTQLEEEASNRVTLHLDNYLATATNIAQINAHAIALGLINIHNYKTARRYFWQQIQAYQDVGFIDYVLPTGEYVDTRQWLDDGSITIDEISAETDEKTYTYATDSQGNRTKMVNDTDDVPLEESWYAELDNQPKFT